MGRLAPDKVAKDFLQQNAYHGYYKKLAGETEARNVQKRMNMSPD